MPYCEVQNIRDSNAKLEDLTTILTTVIESKIAEAESIIKTDLSSIISKNELDAIAADSDEVKLLAIYKTTEKTLVKYFGASRKIDEVSDIKYFQNEYNTLLNKIISGEVKLIADEQDHSPKDYPAITKSNSKFYPRKGVDRFFEDGVSRDMFDDRIK